MQKNEYNDLLDGYLSLKTSNESTKLLMSFFTGRLNNYFTDNCIEAIYPRELDDIIPVLEMVQKLGLQNRMKESFTINWAWAVIAKRFNELFVLWEANEIYRLKFKYNSVLDEINILKSTE
jgi:hypothetical protein